MLTQEILEFLWIITLSLLWQKWDYHLFTSTWGGRHPAQAVWHTEQLNLLGQMNSPNEQADGISKDAAPPRDQRNWIWMGDGCYLCGRPAHGLLGRCLRVFSSCKWNKCYRDHRRPRSFRKGRMRRSWPKRNAKGWHGPNKNMEIFASNFGRKHTSDKTALLGTLENFEKT